MCRVSTGTLTLRNSTVSDNTAIYGGGGGVYNNQSTLTLTNSTIGQYGRRRSIQFWQCDPHQQYRLGQYRRWRCVQRWHSHPQGQHRLGQYGRGRVQKHYHANATVTNSTISGNTPGYSGSRGGVYNYGTLTLSNSTVSGNTGGGVFSNGGTLTLTNSTVSGNTAGFSGGGVHNTSGTLTLRNSTVSGNTATAGPYGGSYGGGLFSGYGKVTVSRSLVSGNTATSGPEIYGTVAANNFNLFGRSGNAGVVGFSPGPTDVIPTVSRSRILAPLAANGGPTRTHALVRGSPAIDAVQTGCPPPRTDQRGVRRPVDGDRDGERLCDIGAFEFRRRGPDG